MTHYDEDVGKLGLPALARRTIVETLGDARQQNRGQSKAAGTQAHGGDRTTYQLIEPPA